MTSDGIETVPIGADVRAADPPLRTGSAESHRVAPGRMPAEDSAATSAASGLTHAQALQAAYALRASPVFRLRPAGGAEASAPARRSTAEAAPVRPRGLAGCLPCGTPSVRE